MTRVTVNFPKREPVYLTDMPAEAPLEMPVQDFSRQPSLARPLKEDGTAFWRLWSIGGAVAITLALMAGLGRWMGADGLGLLEAVVVLLVGLVVVWIAFAATTAVAGAWAVFAHRAARQPDLPARPMSVALLVPMYHEPPETVMGNALALLRDLASKNSRHHFTLFFLSDTRGTAVAEADAFAGLKSLAPAGFPAHYRRRPLNVDRKTGNLADWITRWGGRYEAMLVLDADSLMSGEAVLALADDMARDPNVGLVQTTPQLTGAETVFSRMQQFAGTAYGPLLGHGLKLWAGDTGNYWGHNAIIRTRAFASSAGLPHLTGRGGRKQLIWSHDFIEAALLRRRGWAVRVRPDLEGSYEETPPSLIDHILRDRRWCQGNLQHIRLLGISGLRPISRLFMAQGAAGYLMSVGWLGLLLLWTGLGISGDLGAGDPALGLGLLGAMYGLLLFPKMLALAATLARPAMRKRFGGGWHLIGSSLQEILLSALYAPCMMVQQTLTIMRVAMGQTVGWAPQNRRGGHYALSVLLAFHWVETLAGAMLSGLISEGVLSAWLWPVAGGLLLTLPLSAFSATKTGSRWLCTKRDTDPSQIEIEAAKAAEDLRVVLDRPIHLAAE